MIRSVLVKKIAVIVVLTFLLLGTIFTLRFLVGGGEDTWICVNGQWVKHGNLGVLMSEGGCGGKIVK